MINISIGIKGGVATKPLMKYYEFRVHSSCPKDNEKIKCRITVPFCSRKNSPKIVCILLFLLSASKIFDPYHFRKNIYYCALQEEEEENIIGKNPHQGENVVFLKRKLRVTAAVTAKVSISKWSHRGIDPLLHA